RHGDDDVHDLLEVAGAVHLGGLKEILGQVLDEVAQHKNVEDLRAGDAHDDQRPQGVEQAHRFEQREQRDDVGHAGQEHEQDERGPEHGAEGHLVAGEEVGRENRQEQTHHGAGDGHEDGVGDVGGDELEPEAPVVDLVNAEVETLRGGGHDLGIGRLDVAEDLGPAGHAGFGGLGAVMETVDLGDGDRGAGHPGVLDETGVILKADLHHHVEREQLDHDEEPNHEVFGPVALLVGADSVFWGTTHFSTRTYLLLMKVRARMNTKRIMPTAQA